jgi:cytochrome c553
MIDNRFPTVFGVLGILAMLTGSAYAAEAAPDPGTQREFGAKLEVCGACHGANGKSKSPAIPIIWGQQDTYLLKELQDFHSGERNVEVMSWMSKTLSQEQQAAAAAYFAKKNWPARPVAVAATPPPKGIAVCQACHQQDFSGTTSVNSLTAPRLAGQNYDYLVEAMRRFADGERTNNADMVKIMEAISPADRETMARYISGL